MPNSPTVPPSGAASPPAGRGALLGVVRLFDALERFVLLPVAVISLSALVLLVTADAVLRYIAGSGITSLSEVTGKILMPLLVFLSLTGLAAGRGHVAVDLLTSRYSPRVSRFMNIVFDVLGAAFLALVAYEFIQRFSAMPAGQTTTFVIPLSYPIIIVVVGSALGALRFLVTAWEEALGTRPLADSEHNETIAAL